MTVDDYKKEITTRENEAKLFEKLSDYENELEFYSPEYEIAAIENDSILGKKREIWHKNLNKDIYVDEAINVLSSLKIRKENLLVKN